MGEVEILAAPKLRKAARAAAHRLLEASTEALMLNFPREAQEYVLCSAEGIPYSHVRRLLREDLVVPEPFRAWEYTAEEILRILPSIRRRNPRVKIYCYGRAGYEHLALQTSTRLAVLSYRALASGRLDAEEWRRAVLERLREDEEAFVEESEYVAHLASRCESATCLTSVDGPRYARRLREAGLRVRLSFVGFPYYPLPLERLEAELASSCGRLPAERVEELVRLHLEFLRDYLLPGPSLDDAYEKWVGEKAATGAARPYEPPEARLEG